MNQRLQWHGDLTDIEDLVSWSSQGVQNEMALLHKPRGLYFFGFSVGLSVVVTGSQSRLRFESEETRNRFALFGVVVRSDVHGYAMQVFRYFVVLLTQFTLVLSHENSSQRQAVTSEPWIVPHVADVTGHLRLETGQTSGRYEDPDGWKAHGAPISLCPCDWRSVIDQFKNKCGTEMPDEVIPAPTYFEMVGERLEHVVSLEEADKQDRLKPGTSPQYGIHIDRRLTVAANLQHISHMSKDIEELRRKYQIMSNFWLLSSAPERAMYFDLDENIPENSPTGKTSF